ncbi:MAG: hypothetical protein JEZ11_17400 [Desulfobacterales bacterium]|nr:hypothetical protein [Desulfobacterales bacterium]
MNKRLSLIAVLAVFSLVLFPCSELIADGLTVNSDGSVSIGTPADVGNIRISGNTISSIDGDIILSPGGTGSVVAGSVSTATVAATGGGGLQLHDDGGNGPKVNDGGALTNIKQPGFAAKVTSVVNNVTGNDVVYGLTGAIWTEIFDHGACLSNGTFTAPVDGFYTFSGILQVYPIGTRILRIRLITSNGSFTAFEDAGTSYITESFTFPAWLDASDTAYLEIMVATGSQDVELGALTYFAGTLLN